MTLAEYLKLNRIRPSHFATLLKVQPPTVTRIVKGTRKPSLQLAAEIERVTAGAVSCRDLAGLT